MRGAQNWSPEDATFAHVDLSVLIAVLGLLMIWAGWASATGRLKRNYVIGMRTGTIMRTDATWKSAHKKCAWSFWSSGLVMVATSMVLITVRPSRQWTSALWILISVYLTVAVLIGLAQADRAARGVATAEGRSGVRK